MIWERRPLCVLVLVLVLAIPATMARGDEVSSNVDALFARWDKPDSPGAVVAVVQGGKVLHTRGYGMADLEHDVPITPRTVFHVASVSKQFTAFGSVLNYANVGATSLFTTADDLVLWVANLGAPRVGDERTMARMCAPGKLGSGEPLDYACGLVVDEYRGLRRIGHSGSVAGYRSYVGRFPDQDLGVIVLSNLASFDPMGRAMDVAKLYLGDELKEPGQDQPAAATAGPTAVAVTPAQLDDFAGDYEVADSGVLYTVRHAGERLFSSAPGGSRVELFPLSDSSFFAREIALRVKFHRGEAGRVTHLTFRLGDSAPPEGILARRLEAFAPTAADLAPDAGRYLSPELETSYRLVVKGETLIAENSRHDDTPLRPVRKDRFASSLLGRVRFERDPDGRINGLRASTSRVRNLRFDRRD